ncbi:homoserine kinase [Leisingera methylohalidivorans]|uniref:Aminoglycoside phosphotransferase domain-containing protein n=1 Tax=Leisingera methylohalidivorans DSM 14336 TaxID=999552 RepID=V9W0P9_9RHOB|nr:homoserine kinase [Leisingera methylohalidivorans]AHD03579.1 hypothetical protein METH_22385 [Leisingera methylohalidivorans DSM 14336]
MTDPVTEALALWGMSGAACDFVAGRENRVYRVRGADGAFALRIRRPGLRTGAELRSELQWLDAMDRAGLSVPRPRPSLSGALLETVAGHAVDMVGWLDGRPMGQSRGALDLDDRAGTFFRLGRDMARLHAASDAFDPPPGFARIRWDIDGLLGEAPLWHRFWESPALDAPTRDMLATFRRHARADLEQACADLDFGLIHADLVRENVLVDGDALRLIDFDDGGYGFRLFDIATALIKNRKEPDYDRLKAALIRGYRSVRTLDMARLDLFMALRAVTYVGWIVPRMDEEGSPGRNAFFLEDARYFCWHWLTQPHLT